MRVHIVPSLPSNCKREHSIISSFISSLAQVAIGGGNAGGADAGGGADGGDQAAAPVVGGAGGRVGVAQALSPAMASGRKRDREGILHLARMLHVGVYAMYMRVCSADFPLGVAFLRAGNCCVLCLTGVFFSAAAGGEED